MKHFILLLFILLSFLQKNVAQLVPGDVNKPVNQVYPLAAAKYGTAGAPVFTVIPPTTCGANDGSVTIKWTTGTTATSTRYFAMHNGMDFNGNLYWSCTNPTWICPPGALKLESANTFTRTFSNLRPGLYTFGIYRDPNDDNLNTNQPLPAGNVFDDYNGNTTPGNDPTSDQNRCAIVGVYLLPNTNNLTTCTISHTNATNCITRNGQIVISGLQSGVTYEIQDTIGNTFNIIKTVAPGKDTLQINNLLTGIYPIKIRRQGEICYRQFNIKVGNDGGIDCFVADQLIDASLGNNLIRRGNFGVSTGELPRNTADVLGSGTTDYTQVSWSGGEPGDSRYALDDTTNHLPNGITASYTYRLRHLSFPSQNRHLYSCIQRSGDHTGSQDQNNGNTGAGQGYMMIVNANYRTDKIINIKGISLKEGNNYYFSFWGKNLQPFMPKNKNNTNTLDSTSQPIIPRIALAVNGIIYDFADMSATLEPTSYTGMDTALVQMGWERYNLRFVAPETNTNSNITLYNFQQGGFGNDFAIDDIEFLALSTMGDRVWNDLDRDGIQDTNEPGMANVTVNLLDANDKILQTTLSDAFGYYQFANISPAAAPAGTDYKIKFFAPAGYKFTIVGAAGSNFENNNDAGPLGLTGFYNLVTDSSKISIDCGLVFDEPLQPSSVGNLVWFDANGNGIQDGTETGLANVTVALYNTSSTVLNTTVSNASGFYRFDNVAAGNYRVGVTLKPGTIVSPKNASGPATDNDVNDSGPNVRQSDIFTVGTSTIMETIDIGLKIMPTTSSSFGDFCWIDVNPNGIQDTTALGFEPGLPGVKVILFNPGADNLQFTGDDTRIDSMFTDAFGQWQFTNLTGTRYYVQFIRPAGYNFTLLNQGSNEQLDSDITGTGYSPIIYINNTPYGYNYEVLDVGFVATPVVPNAGTIGNFFFNDINGNGVQETGEFGVSGITVDLLNSGGTKIASTVTNLNGFYRFTDLPAPATYSVKFSNIPPGYQITQQDLGGDDTKDSDIDITTGATASFVLAASQINRDIDGGIRQVLYTGTCSVGNYVWFDLDSDGIQDNIETGAPNITVNLYNATTNTLVATTVTNSLGQYVFNGLPQELYYITFTGLSAGFSVTTKDVSADAFDNIDNDASLVTGVVRTSNFRLFFGQDKLNIALGITLANNINIIGDRVWIDVNGDGIQDFTENNGVQSVIIQLLNSAGNLIDTDGATAGIQPYQTVSNRYGYWSFVDVPNGTYKPRFSFLPPGFRLSKNKASGNNNTDSDALGNGRSVLDVTINGSNRRDFTTDLGLIPQSTAVGDYVWDDANGNGIQDAAEFGIPSVTATIYNTAGVALGSSVTNSEGKYYFQNIPKGTYYLTYANYPVGMQYTVQESNPFGTNGSNVNQLTSRTNNYNINTFGDTLHIDAGLRVLNTANIGNQIWFDANGDGLQNNNEPPVAGVTVTLKNAGPNGIVGDADDYVLGTTMSDGNGFYQFIITPTGNNYYIQFGNIPGGSPYTVANAAAGVNDSRPNGLGVTPTFSLGYGATNQSQDAGIINISILSLDYEYFTAEKHNNGGFLNWKVSNPIEVSRYEVLHSTDGYHFTKIAVLPGNFSNNLNYLHSGVVKGNNFYKIASYDAGGRLSLSDIKVIKYDEVKTISIYPNPASEKLFIKLTNNADLQKATYTIIDINGKTSIKGTMNMNVSNNSIAINTLVAGSYIIVIRENDKKLLKESFIKK
jgi:hypothetical protein